MQPSRPQNAAIQPSVCVRSGTYAANTTRSYATALRYWAGWHQGRYGIELALPVSEAVVIQFLVDHIQRKSKAELVSELPSALDQALVAAGLKARIGPLKLSTVVQRVAVLSTAHSSSGWPILASCLVSAPCSAAPDEPR